MTTLQELNDLTSASFVKGRDDGQIDRFQFVISSETSLEHAHVFIQKK